MKALRILLLALAATAVQAQEFTSKDADAIRAVITAQINAFRVDDGDKAFALATPGIRAQFGGAAAFLAMVKAEYPVVYRPKSVIFERPGTLDGGIVQPVRFTDAEGRGWTAIYPMERQPGGDWRINGCYLERVAGRET